jgi:hypothetical protein
MEKQKYLFNDPELVKLVDSLNNSQTNRINMAVFFATASVGLLSYGIKETNANIILMASFLMIFYMVADYYILRGIYGYLVRARIILKENTVKVEDTIFGFYRLVFVSNTELQKQIDSIADDEETFEKRAIRIQKLPRKIKSTLGFWIPFTFCLIEIIVSFILHFNSDWELLWF